MQNDVIGQLTADAIRMRETAQSANLAFAAHLLDMVVLELIQGRMPEQDEDMVTARSVRRSAKTR